MAPLVVLVAVTLLARAAGQLGVARFRDLAACVRIGLAVMFCFTAAAHFNSMRPDMIAMVPPSVPNPAFMVTSCSRPSLPTCCRVQITPGTNGPVDLPPILSVEVQTL
jgi:hypothetical protein